jgi:putative DNA primase/helicase
MNTKTNAAEDDSQDRKTLKAIRSCVQYAVKNAAGKDCSGVEGNESSLAKLFSIMFGDVCKYVKTIGFMVYYPETGCFISDIAETVIVALLDRIIRETWQECFENKDLAKFLEKCKSHRIQTNIVEMIKKNELIFILPDELNRDPFLLNCQGEAYDLKNREVRPSLPTDLFTMTTGVKPVRGKCKKFEQFLMETFQNIVPVIAWFMRWVGYGLTGDMSCAWFVNAWGGGGNGKGVLNEILNCICGTYRTALPDRIVIENRYGNPGGPEPEYYSIMETRSGYCDEIPPAKLNMSTIKKITGKTAIKFRGMRENSFTEFVSKTKLTLFSNNILLPRDVDDATRRRVRFVKFLNKPVKENPALAEEIKAEAAAILYWMIDEARAYAQNPGKDGFPQCDEIELASRELLDQADEVQQFIDAKCKVDKAASVKKSELYRAYKAWADEEGKDRPVGPGHFSEDLQKKGYPISATCGSFYFRGLRIKGKFDFE